MKVWVVSGLIMTSALFSPWLSAAERRYVATPQQSQWLMLNNTPLECQLSHPIPNYGTAVFTSQASKKINLDFELKMHRPMGETRAVNLVSQPAHWQPGKAAQPIMQLQFFKQFDGYLGGQNAWALLSELEKGRYPTFSFQDWQDRDHFTEVALSAVQFQGSYAVFSQCLANLLPYSFEDIAFTILHYDRGDSVELNKASQQRLAQIAEYVKYNKDIDLVLMSTYTDSALGNNESQQLSELRAKALQGYFESLGLADDRIEVQGYGKRRPIADNSTPLGKDKNRRVVISLGRITL